MNCVTNLRLTDYSWLLLTVITLLACFFLPDYLPSEVEKAWSDPPSWQEGLLFGTFQARNLLYWVLDSARITLKLSLLSLLISLVLGLAVIFLQFHDRTEKVVRKIIASCAYFPRLFFLIILAAFLSLEKPSQLYLASSWYLIILLGITGAIFLAAQTSGEVGSLKRELFVYFARSLSLPPRVIFWRHILPNCTSIPLSTAKQLRDNVIFVSSLSFIGLVHLQPEDLGGLIYRLYSSPEAYYQGWWILFFPCLFLCWLIFLSDKLSHRLSVSR